MFTPLRIKREPANGPPSSLARKLHKVPKPRSSRLQGIISVRKLLKRLPDAVRQELIVQHHLTGREVLALQNAKVPRKTGALQRGLSMKVLPATGTLRVGLIGKPTNRRLFYGRIVQFGRKAQVVIATRKYAALAGHKAFGRNYKNAALKAGIKGTYRLRVPAMAGRNFIYPMTREQIAAPYANIWVRALTKAGMGQ
jgi:hypothetical protein